MSDEDGVYGLPPLCTPLNYYIRFKKPPSSSLIAHRSSLVYGCEGAAYQRPTPEAKARASARRSPVTSVNKRRVVVGPKAFAQRAGASNPPPLESATHHSPVFSAATTASARPSPLTSPSKGWPP